jgi:hypothetical protein
MGNSHRHDSVELTCPRHDGSPSTVKGFPRLDAVVAFDDHGAGALETPVRDTALRLIARLEACGCPQIFLDGTGGPSLPEGVPTIEHPTRFRGHGRSSSGLLAQMERKR